MPGDPHELAHVMTTAGGLARRFVCTCGESGPAVIDDDAARGEHQRHAEFRRRHDQEQDR